MKLLFIVQAMLFKYKFIISDAFASSRKQSFETNDLNAAQTSNNLGTEKSGVSLVYKAQGGSPEENMEHLLSMIGGIENIIDKNDIVVLKPNAQWWAQGMTNTDSMKSFMNAVLTLQGFKGEIIIAENHQYKDVNGRGWSTSKRNGSYNFNELIEYFHSKGFNNVSKYHWRAAGPNPKPREGDDAGDGAAIKGPSDGDGYVWRDDIVYVSPHGKKCWMTYPVFTSKYSGITVDLKNGPWKDGSYLKDRKVKFINFSALNHHSKYCGVTASVKNLMGVVDMTCGFHAPTPEGTYNVHFIGLNKFILKHLWRIPSSKIREAMWSFAHKNFHFTGGALGKFIKEIRFPDLNIITAHHVGWGSRTDPLKSSYPKALLCSRDPVALDYIAAKHILLKETPENEPDFLSLNDPDDSGGPFYRFLSECHKQGIGNFSKKHIRFIT